MTVTSRDPDEFMIHTDGQVIVQGDLARQIATVGQIDNHDYGKLVWTDTKIDTEFHGGNISAI